MTVKLEKQLVDQLGDRLFLQAPFWLEGVAQIQNQLTDQLWDQFGNQLQRQLWDDFEH